MKARVPPAMKAALAALPAERPGYGYLRENIAASGELLDDLEFARAFVPYLFSVGLLSVSRENGLLTVAIAVATERFGLDAALKVVQGASDDEQRENAAYSVLDAGVLAGYVLGLAAGQRLGGDGFEAPSLVSQARRAGRRKPVRK